MPAIYTLQSFTQTTNGGNAAVIRCEVIGTDADEGLSCPITCPPITLESDDWTNQQLADACSVATGRTVVLPPVPEVLDTALRPVAAIG